MSAAKPERTYYKLQPVLDRDISWFNNSFTNEVKNIDDSKKAELNLADKATGGVETNKQLIARLYTVGDTQHILLFNSPAKKGDLISNYSVFTLDNASKQLTEQTKDKTTAVAGGAKRSSSQSSPRPKARAPCKPRKSPKN